MYFTLCFSSVVTLVHCGLEDLHIVLWDCKQTREDDNYPVKHSEMSESCLFS